MSLLVSMDATDDIFAKGDDAVAQLKRKADHTLGRVLGVRARVDVVSSDAIPRTDFKARRVIDDRDLFKSLMNGEGGT